MERRLGQGDLRSRTGKHKFWDMGIKASGQGDLGSRTGRQTLGHGDKDWDRESWAMGQKDTLGNGDIGIGTGRHGL